MLATEAVRSVMALEAAHTSDPALDATMVLFKAVVQVGTRPVPDGLAGSVRCRATRLALNDKTRNV